MKVNNLKQECPSCYYEMDCATPMVGEATPKPGDISICINCTKLLLYDEKLNLQVATEDVIETIPDGVMDMIRQAQHWIRQHQYLRKKDDASKLPGPVR